MLLPGKSGEPIVETLKSDPSKSVGYIAETCFSKGLSYNSFWANFHQGHHKITSLLACFSIF